MTKCAVFIDGPNMWTATEHIGLKIDFKGLKLWLAKQYIQYEVSYYTAVQKDIDGFINLKKVLDYLEYNGIRLVQKEGKIIKKENSNEGFFKGNLDTELVTDMILAAKYYDHMILMSGDGDFTYPVKRLRELGVYVTVISATVWKENKHNVIADELRRACNKFININNPEECVELPFIISQRSNT